MDKNSSINLNQNKPLANMMEIIAQKSSRLDLYLQEELQTSRNQIEQLIKKVGISINGKLIFKSGFKIKNGDIIKFELPKAEIEKKFDVNFEIEKIYEDRELLIVNKPPHIIVHPANSTKEPTLVDWLKQQNISLSTLSGEERHGIVHRIDKETSGALVIAKNNKTHTHLSKQLENKSMGRYYLAIIDLPLKKDVIVENYIQRAKHDRTKMSTSNSDGRYSKSAFKKLLLSKKGDKELIACKLYTGRTHQIRVHLESLSRHILHDYKYGYKSKKLENSRVMLHAYIIYFEHPEIKKLIIKKAPLFEDFKSILKRDFDMEAIDEKIDPSFIIDNFNNTDQWM